MSKKNKKEKINSYLIFELHNESFAIHVKKVLSILEMKSITKIPQTPDYMKGIINLRGNVLPVIDSHVKFNLPPLKINMKTSILVLEFKNENTKTIKLGLMVDKVNEVLQIEKGKILDPPNIGVKNKLNYISGIFKKDDRSFIMLINIDKVLSVEEMISMGDLEELKEGIKKEVTLKTD